MPSLPRKATWKAESPSPVSISTGRAMARVWSLEVDDRRRQAAAWSFMTSAVAAYVTATGSSSGVSPHLSPIPVAMTFQLDSAAEALAASIGQAAAALPLEEACFQLSACYTALLPQALRSDWGAFYTPPALTTRLMQLAEEAGTDWSTARVLDPACGGGAFLLPVALRMKAALPEASANQLLDHFGSHLQGFEIDPFAAWLTQAWLEIAFSKELKATSRSFANVVRVCDSLEQDVETPFDLVIGNPPYGRVTLTEEQRARYKRSLFGHANLYGVFTDLAVRWTRKGGIIAYVTPTSFLAGEYFKALRKLLASEAPLVAVDFITSRRGVFDDVLQEALLATYARGSRRKQASIHYLAYAGTEAGAEIAPAGRFKLPDDASSPWLAPRQPEHRALAEVLWKMEGRLRDWGYAVATGPLVWNRFKDQFRAEERKGRLPVIWAEAVTSEGEFVFRAERRGHQPYFEMKTGDEWLQVNEPCVLLQRTTAKEQDRRLIAAELPQSFLDEHGGATVENHLNMIRPIAKPKVSAATVAMVLNSPIVDAAFRCISGSVAVSAFELEALPLPSADQMKSIDKLVTKGTAREDIHRALEKLYAEAHA